MKKISIEESHEFTLGIAKAISEICTRHSIPYYIVYGTLLGAVRHKGFIPWDDDMDICVPLQYYKQFVVAMKQELQYPYQCWFYNDKDSHCHTYFAKIEDCRTVMDDIRSFDSIEKRLGVNVDVFPLVCCEKEDPMLRKIERIQRWRKRIYVGTTNPTPLKIIIKKILKHICPISHNTFHDWTWKNIYKVKPGKYMNCLTNVYGDRENLPKEFFGEGRKYKFESLELNGPEMYDEYLTQIYHDYMLLPPVEKQITHSSNIYLR